jgi:hypothetical protein
MGRDRLLKHLLRERFVITLRGGESFDGLLVDADEKTVRLASAFALGEKSRVSVDGELFIPRAEIVYLQKPGASA